ncbi:unnamed protein product [Caenorhabditis sp. 36 PRJEB53466]|nr:unnamed protein product [Caenorhabditis sp. 36 PRJEB53466]
MISPQGVALAALLVLGVHCSLLDDIRSKFGSQQSSLKSGLFGRPNTAFSSDFKMPSIAAGAAAVVHSSSSHKGQHHSSGSSSDTHSLTVVGADGKNLTEESEKKAGFNKDSKVDQAQENLMLKTQDGGVINQGVSHNKSSVDEGDYLLDSSKKQEVDKDGHQININNNKIANHTRAAALDEANQFFDAKNKDGTHFSNNTGHKNTDEHLGKYELENNAASEIGADGTSHNVTNTKGSIGDSHKSDQLAYDQSASVDAAGNVQTSNYSKKASSEAGNSADFSSNMDAIKNADGTSFSNSTGNFANTSYAKAAAEELMAKKNVSVDGTMSLEASHTGSNSSKINSASGAYADVNAVGANGTMSHVVSNKTNDYALDEANESAGSLKAEIGKNGTYSLSEKNVESGRKDESNNNTAVDQIDAVAADGSVSSLHSKSADGTSLSQRGNKTHQSDLSRDADGNVKNHTIDGSYRNKKTGQFGNFDMTASQKNADGAMSLATYGNDTNKNTYEAEKTAQENLLEQNADGTYKEENKGSNSRVNRTDGGSNVHAANFAKGLNGVMSNETVSASNAFNTSDAESNQYDHLKQKSANGTIVDHAKDSKQVAASSNSKSSLDSASSSVDAAGNKKSLVNSEANDSHDAVSMSNDTDASSIQHADGSKTQIVDSSVQGVNEHNDSSKKKLHALEQNSDGSFSDVSSDSATKNAQKDATDQRTNAFVNVDAAGNSVQELKTSLVENHKNDTDASSNQNVHVKSKDGSELNDVKKTNVSTSSLTEAQLASNRKNLQLADGSQVASESSSAITHEKNRNDAASLHKMNHTNADGSKTQLDEGSNQHSDLETRGESARKQNYQKLGNGTEMSMDVGYEKSKATGSDTSSSHIDSLADDGKGHFKKEKNGTATHHEIDNKDVKTHSNSIST